MEETLGADEAHDVTSFLLRNQTEQAVFTLLVEATGQGKASIKNRARCQFR